jgi:hypothetical protein
LLLIGEDSDKQSLKDLTKQSEGESPNNEPESKVYIFFFLLVSNLSEHFEKIGRLDLFVFFFFFEIDLTEPRFAFNWKEKAELVLFASTQQNWSCLHQHSGIGLVRILG